MGNKRGLYLILISVFIAAYYLLLGIYLNRLGYYNQESLFYIEKSKILFEGLGNKLKVMGLTTPILPFYGTFTFFKINNLHTNEINVNVLINFQRRPSSVIYRLSETYFTVNNNRR